MAGSMTMLFALCLLVAAAAGSPLYGENGGLIVRNSGAHNPTPDIEKQLKDLRDDLTNNGRETPGGRMVPANTQQGKDSNQDTPRAPTNTPAATPAPTPAPAPAPQPSPVQTGGNGGRCGNGQNNSGFGNGINNDGDCNGNNNSGNQNG